MPRSGFWLVVLPLLLTALTARAQSIKIQALPTSLCGGSTIQLAFSYVNGFVPNEPVRIELIDGSNYVVARLVENVTSTIAFVPLPTNLSDNYFRLRVYSSNPFAYTDSTPFKLARSPRVQVVSPVVGPYFINPGESFRPLLQLRGGGPYVIRLNDTIAVYTDELAEAVQPVLTPSQSTTYRVTYIENNCGRGTASGEASVSVGTAGLLVTRLSTREPCAGETIDVHYSTDRQLTGSPTYKVEFQPIDPKQQAYTVSASGTASPARVVVPPVAAGGAYRLRLFSESAGVSAYYKDNFGDQASYIQLRQLPTVQLSGNRTINFGQTALLNATVATQGLMVLTLSDGTEQTIQATETSPARLLRVAPAQTTTYTLRNVASNCGSRGAEAGSGSATVTVRPGFRIDSLSTLALCAGQEVSVFFTTNEATVSTDPATYGLRGSTAFSDDDQLVGGQVTLDVLRVTPGSQPGTGILVATPRALPADYINNPAYGPKGALLTGNFYLQMARNGSAGNVFRRVVAIADKPQLILESQPITVARPQLVYPIAQLTGHATPTDITLSDGTRQTVPGDIGFGDTKSVATPVGVMARANGQFSVTSVQNRCGVGTATGTVAISVQRTDTTALYMGPIPTTICVGTTIPVSFTAVGNTGNTFRVELADDDGIFRGKLIGASTSSPINAAIPANLGIHSVQKIRVIALGGPTPASQPRSFVFVDPTQVVRLFTVTGTTEAVTRIGEPTTLRLLTTGASNTDVVLSDGRRLTLTNVSTDLPVTPAQTTTYTIRSARNACGVAAGTGTVTVRVQPFWLQPQLSQTTFCENDSLSVHVVVRGEIPAGATHALQLLLNGNVVQTLPARFQGNRLKCALPSTISFRTAYTVRVLTTVAIVQYYSALSAGTFLVYKYPKIRLVPPSAGTILLDENQNSVNVQLVDPGNGLPAMLDSRIQYRINNQTYAAIDNLPVTVKLLANSAATTNYQISSVYDAFCGFGVADGSVRVAYRPGLRSISLSKFLICRGGDQAILSYEISGEFAADARFTAYLVNASGTKIRLGQSAKPIDKLPFTVDPGVASGSYQVVLESSVPNLPGFSNFPSITVGDPPVVALRPTSSVQYPDQTVTVSAKVVSGFLPVSLTLTDGSSQTLTAFDNTFTFAPRQSGVYQVAQVANVCGAGQASGTVSVTVLPNSPTQVRVASVSSQGTVAQVCIGGTLTVALDARGTFGPGNQFTIFLSDSTGQNYRPLTTQNVSATTLAAVLPPDVLPGAGYQVRVGASNPSLLGSVSTPLTVRGSLTGVLTAATTAYRGELTSLTISLSGIGPWSVTLTNNRYGTERFTVTNSPYLYPFQPDSTTTFQLLGVGNTLCGAGQATGRVTVTVLNALGVEPTGVTVIAYPNPTAGQLRIKGDWPNPQQVSLSLTDATGRTVYTTAHDRPGPAFQTDLDLSLFAPGLYMLTITADGVKTVVKVMKE
ncbi:T9SS type A sorting domain-containing protein [Fibrella aquatilis]|uniref:T9SS type A sorting domain-containing protein n=1 Tax=Fibrella aquatilis TaxID=2817059 RepID=A0A939GCJ7_9BACT|nr:T9SS type A sorting domain-containing protein [Fibrella aquatilis]MBO0934754.1 T9SS type A sorting domain-containing protein [Fibrella aquatilis]